jgi:hypothetical protein
MFPNVYKVQVSQWIPVDMTLASLKATDKDPVSLYLKNIIGSAFFLPDVR